MITAIDIGYAYTKVAANDHTAIYPSVVGSPDLPRFGTSHYDAIVIENGMGRVSVGDAAIEQSRFVDHREDRTWISSDQYKALYYAALTEASRGTRVDMTLISGLPLAFYEDRRTLENILAGEHRVYRQYDNGPMTHVYNVKAYVIPQPFGALFSLGFSPSGTIADAAILQGRIGIIDVGGKTVNLLTAEKGGEVIRSTASVNRGCWNIVRAVERELSQICSDLSPRPHEIIQYIQDKAVPYYGAQVDISQMLDELTIPFARSIIASATQLWNGGASLDTILISGGGAHIIGPQLQAHFSRHRDVRVVEDPVFANVRGYLYYGRWAEKEGQI